MISISSQLHNFLVQPFASSVKFSLLWKLCWQTHKMADASPCGICRQPRNLCRRSSRSFTKFSVKMIADHFEDYSILPCCYKLRIDTICPTKVIKVIARPDEELDAQENDLTTHHILLDDCAEYYAIEGPYYRSLLSAFQITDGDTVTFSWDECTNTYDVSVQSEQNVPKKWVGFPECQDLPAECEHTFYSSYFTDGTDVSQQEMNRLIQCYQQYMNDPYYNNYFPKFIIHRLANGDVSKWELPLDAVKLDGDLPKKGQAMYHMNDRTHPGSYKIIDSDTIMFREYWADFRADNSIWVGELFVARVAHNPDFIGLDVKII